MRALLAQLAPEPGAPEANARRAADALRQHDVELAAFPELFLTGYDLATAAGTAIEADSAPIGTLRAVAAETRTALIAGFAERRGSAVANAAAVIDEHGELAAIYRKSHLFGEEGDVFTAGDELVIAELAGRRVGPLICFDVEFPEPSRALARAGAELLVTVAANMEPFFGDHLLASRARALDNRLPHLYVNRCGEEGGLRFVGGTRAVRADGTVAATADGDGERLVCVAVDAAGSEDARLDYLEQLRDDLRVVTPTPATGGRR